MKSQIVFIVKASTKEVMITQNETRNRMGN